MNWFSARKLSIGLRLSLWYLLIFAVAQCVFGVGMYVVLQHHLREIVDNSLQNEMDDLRNVLLAQRQSADIAEIREEVAEAYLHDHAGEYLQILTSDGAEIYKSAFLSKHSLLLISAEEAKKKRYENRVMDGRPFRFLTSTIDAQGHIFLVQLGAPTQEVRETVGAFRRYLLWLAPLVLIVAALGGNWLSHLALAPVDALTRTARTINVTNLSSRVEKLDTGDELQRLSDTLNEMLARIEAAVLRITEFTADASHELRTPVALIRTEAEVALGRPRSEQEYRSALQYVLVESERMTQLLEQLLSLVRADSGRETLHMTEINLGTLAREALDGWQKVAVSRGLRLTGLVPAQQIDILGDGSALRRVFDVLLDNAMKYSSSGGEIQLSVEPFPELVLLKVRNPGDGIAQEEQAKIFERFYRVDKARSRQMGGAGLGLAIAQWIVHQHRGAITVLSTPGRGAEFLVELPLDASRKNWPQTADHFPAL
jgi:heavy metal sensor kinase